MNRVFSFFTMMLVGVLATAQTSAYNQTVWLNGRMMCAGSVAAIDSITYIDNAIGLDTLHLLLPRTIVYTQHDTITVHQHDTLYFSTCAESTKGVGTYYTGADKLITFAPGNLQYQASTGIWRFAENQYDTIGKANSNISATYTGWIDLFGWGTGNNPANTSTNNAYYPSFVDWGTNVIGTDAPNTWRTPTADEWKYIFTHTRWTIANVNGVWGFMLLQDDFVTPSGISINIVGNGNLSAYGLNISSDIYASNVYTASQFAQLEALGCVFLPCAGVRGGNVVIKVGAVGHYGSTTPSDGTDVFGLYFSAKLAGAYMIWDRYYGQAIRLVQDIKQP